MNILWQNQHYPDVIKGGGGAINTGYIVRALLAQHHHAVILAQAREGQSMETEQVNGTCVIRAPKPRLPPKIWPLWPFLESYYLHASVKEVAHSFDGFVCIDAPYALAFRRLFPNRPLVYRVEGSMRSHAAAVPPPADEASFSLREKKLKAWRRMFVFENEIVEQWAWKKSDALVVKSQFMRNELVNLYKVPIEKVHIIPNGVDFARYACARAQTPTLETLGKNCDNKTTIIYCGRLVRMKNVEFLLRAFARMRRRNQCRLAILGDGDERDNLEREASALGLARDVNFLGHRDRVEEYLAAADVFVLPSTYEPFGNALVEAMAAGLPSIALRPDGARIRTASAEIVEDGYSGFLVDPSDPAELARRLDDLAADPSLRKLIGTQGQEACRTKFDWSRCASEYVRLLELSSKS